MALRIVRRRSRESHHASSRPSGLKAASLENIVQVADTFDVSTELVRWRMNAFTQI
jgi:hypothetical protein